MEECTKESGQEIVSCAQVIIGRRTGEIEQVPVVIAVGFGRDGAVVENGLAHVRIVKTQDGYALREEGDQRGTLFNDVPMKEACKEEDSVLGDGVHELKEGDVIHVREDGDGKDRVAMIFHERAERNITWQSQPLNQTEKVLYISRHEEEISDGEIQREDEALPEHYAVLKNEDGGWTVEDHSTYFGVFVNNRPVRGKKKLELMDVIRIGHTLFLYRGSELLYNHKTYDQNQLKIDIQERRAGGLFRKKVLLEDISMSIQVGEMVLVLGGSGAGKTTFIHAVMGYEKADGTIMKGDRDIYKEYGKMKYSIGFVPQQDLLRMEDTVFDTLENAARMKMPADTTREERIARIDEILEMFGLEREKKTLVEKLSGGQRKRLSIAVEFVAKPALFFLDEPDSGLDGVMARYLMENLRRIADQEKIVVVITHTPDRAVDLFDKVVVLAKSQEDNVGRLAFFGNIDEAKQFFDVDTMEQIIKRINRPDEGGEGRADEFIEKFEELRKKGSDSDGRENRQDRTDSDLRWKAVSDFLS
ncbi:MAG: ATP-binding cassette domain-containing protein [Lachnospiraceae bacterium]|nr:ATP-binding cassette domain-containing protein [Lachnospiraceae bacterium]